jgi:DNA-binding transcriptional MerR regulator
VSFRQKDACFCRRSVSFRQKDARFCRRSPRFCRRTAFLRPRAARFCRRSVFLRQKDAPFCRRRAVLGVRGVLLRPRGVLLRGRSTLLRRKNVSLGARTLVLRARSTVLRARDAFLRARGTFLRARGTFFGARGTFLRARDTFLRARDAFLRKRSPLLGRRSVLLMSTRALLLWKAERLRVRGSSFGRKRRLLRRSLGLMATMDELVRDTGTPERTIRDYDRRGLLPEWNEVEGYTAAHVTTLLAIARLREEGVRLHRDLRKRLSAMAPKELERYAHGRDEEVEEPLASPPAVSPPMHAVQPLEAAPTEGAGRHETWTRIVLRPGLEVHVRSGAGEEIQRLAGEIDGRYGQR